MFLTQHDHPLSPFRLWTPPRADVVTAAQPPSFILTPSLLLTFKPSQPSRPEQVSGDETSHRAEGRGRNTCLHRTQTDSSFSAPKGVFLSSQCDQCMHAFSKDDGDADDSRSACVFVLAKTDAGGRRLSPAYPSSSALASRPGTSPALPRPRRRRLAGTALSLGKRRSAARPLC